MNDDKSILPQRSKRHPSAPLYLIITCQINTYNVDHWDFTTAIPEEPITYPYRSAGEE
jgi:hypothetical protein